MKARSMLPSEASPRSIVDDDDDLSAEQVQELLREAEQRLLAKNAPPDSAAVEVSEDSMQLTSEFNANTLPHFSFPSLNFGKLPQPYVSASGDLAHVDASRLVDSKYRKLADTPRKVEDPVKVKRNLKKDKEATAGSDWFNLPRTKLTPELKRDLQLLRMRSVLDPKRHYKKESSKQLVPDFCQVGTIVAGPTEFFSSRVPNKERKQTFVDEVLSKDDDLRRFKNKYDEVQKSKTSGKKAYYKSLKAKRSSGMKNR